MYKSYHSIMYYCQLACFWLIYVRDRGRHEMRNMSNIVHNLSRKAWRSFWRCFWLLHAELLWVAFVLIVILWLHHSIMHHHGLCEEKFLQRQQLSVLIDYSLIVIDYNKLFEAWRVGSRIDLIDCSSLA